MLRKIDNSKKMGNRHISILYPGLELSQDDTGYATIGRIDHADIDQGVVIKMHPHINDDILSYFRSGKIKHTDSRGYSEVITPTRLMLMKAGQLFYHEEAVIEDMDGFQIFIRPRVKDSIPEVIFQTLDNVHSLNTWRLIASPNTKLQMSSDTYIYDMKITVDNVFHLPEAPMKDFAYLLYIFRGHIAVNDKISLQKGESLFIRDEPISFTADSEAELVLFATNTEAEYFDQGMYSGNQRR